MILRYLIRGFRLTAALLWVQRASRGRWRGDCERGSTAEPCARETGSRWTMRVATRVARTAILLALVDRPTAAMSNCQSPTNRLANQRVLVTGAGRCGGIVSSAVCSVRGTSTCVSPVGASGGPSHTFAVGRAREWPSQRERGRNWKRRRRSRSTSAGHRNLS